MKIDHFRGEYAFLSNFWEVPVTYMGLTYGSNEAAFQAQKCMTEEEKQLSVAGVFIAVGIHPTTELLKGMVAMDEAGYVLAGEDGATDCTGVFVAGDIRKKPLRQIVTAVADGANAAVSASNYCNHLGK